MINLLQLFSTTWRVPKKNLIAIITLVTQDGRRVRGVTKSEDAFSIQVVDTAERLQGYLKADLREVSDEERSLMPQFGPDRLSDDELDDLLRYLGTLRPTDSSRR